MQTEIIGNTNISIHDGPVISSEQDALDIIGETYGSDVTLIVLPVERLAPDFFRLSTGLAGAVLQKFQNYGLGVAILGDVSDRAAASAPLRDFIGESNRHGRIIFVADRAALEARLAPRPGT